MRRALILVLVTATVPHAVWPQGNPLGGEFRVNTYTTNGQQRPCVAVGTASGDFVVVWFSAGQDGSDTGVFGQRYAGSGAALGPEFRVNSFTTGAQGFVIASVASDPSGNFVATWTSDEQDGSYLGVFAQRFSSGGSPLGPEFRVNSYTTHVQDESSVAVDASGNFVVVWDSVMPPSDDGIFGQRYAASGTALGLEFQISLTPRVLVDSPVVASDPVGNFVVIWINGGVDGSGVGVFGRRFAGSGAPLGPEFRVNTYTTYHQSYPDVASDASGNFVVVWSSPQDGNGYGIYGQRFASSGAPLGPEFRVNTYWVGYQGGDFTLGPSVATDPSGNFVVAWGSYGQDGSNGGIYAQRYASSGAPVGPEFRVNTFTTSHQKYPSVASDGAGNFVVAWSSFLEDGDLDGIFAQRFGPIVPVVLTGFTVE